MMNGQLPFTPHKNYESLISPVPQHTSLQKFMYMSQFISEISRAKSRASTDGASQPAVRACNKIAAISSAITSDQRHISYTDWLVGEPFF